MRAEDLIRRKRDGGAIEPEEITALIAAYGREEVGDEQMAAFCMAVFFRGMSDAESAALVRAMLESGEVLDLSDIPGLKVDKHSTGGVGDKISICLAPLVAACGTPVPMISGRGLGHTGGTLDKLGAIPGFSTDQDTSTFRRLVKEHGLGLIGQTAQLAPADKRLYALRDVTATVESVPLIAASIMSKKLAEGIDALVLDVKHGSGAFMKTEAQARELAEALVGVGQRAGKPTTAYLTRMDRVLGEAVGNANETWEAIEILRGRGPADVRELTVVLGAEMLRLGQVASSVEDGRARIERAIADGSGLEKLREVVAAQGGAPEALDARDRLPDVSSRTLAVSEGSGWVTAVDVAAVGRAAMVLGAGRARASDTIDPAVGLMMRATVGDRLEPGQPLAEIAHRDGRGVEQAQAILRRAFVLGDAPPAEAPLVLDRIEGGPK